MSWFKDVVPKYEPDYVCDFDEGHASLWRVEVDSPDLKEVDVSKQIDFDELFESKEK